MAYGVWTGLTCHYALLVISEAAKRLGPKAEELCPGFPWRDIRGTVSDLTDANPDVAGEAGIWLFSHPRWSAARDEAQHSFRGIDDPVHYDS